MSQCFWSQFEPATVTFCEPARTCEVFQTLANTYSNAVYILVGIILIFLAVKEKPRFGLWGFPISAICVGIGSWLFHMTGTFWGEVLDVESMYLFSSLLIAFNAQRLWGLSTFGTGVTYAVSVLTSLAVLLTWHPIGVNLFVGHVVLFLSLEIAIWLKWRRVFSLVELYKYMPLLYLGIFFGAAWGVWWLDILKVWCPSWSHYFNGHTAWHFLNCVCFYWAYRFYQNPPYLHPKGFLDYVRGVYKPKRHS